MTSLYKISAGGGLSSVQKQSLHKEETLEDWIEGNPALVGLDVLVLGRQIITDHNGRIDMLAIDRDGNLIIIELKRDRTPREVVAQILDYASWVSDLEAKDIDQIAQKKLGKSLEQAFLEKFSSPAPDTINTNHSMMIVASEFDASSKRIVEYLAKVHRVGINTVFFNVFADGENQFLATDWLMDQQEVVERSEDRKKLPWSGFWYVNVGEGPQRAWEDMRKYGFIAAGGGSFYSDKLNQLSVGDTIYAYQKKAGYVGHGVVTQTASMAKDFKVDGKSIFALPLERRELSHDQDDPEMAEYVVGVRWLSTVSIANAKTFTGAFANQNIVCKLRDQKTVEFLKHEFA